MTVIDLAIGGAVSRRAAAQLGMNCGAGVHVAKLGGSCLGCGAPGPLEVQPRADLVARMQTAVRDAALARRTAKGTVRA